MSMQTNQTGYAQLRKQAAIALLRIATTFQANQKAEYKAGPPRSQPGEYLRAETWNARDNIVYTPTSVSDVAQSLEVRVGYRTNSWYAAMWETRRDNQRRKGLYDKLVEFQKSGITAGIMSSYTG